MNDDPLAPLTLPLKRFGGELKVSKKQTKKWQRLIQIGREFEKRRTDQVIACILGVEETDVPD